MSAPRLLGEHAADLIDGETARVGARLGDRVSVDGAEVDQLTLQAAAQQPQALVGLEPRAVEQHLFQLVGALQIEQPVGVAWPAALELQFRRCGRCPAGGGVHGHQQVVDHRVAAPEQLLDARDLAADAHDRVQPAACAVHQRA